VWNHNYDIKYKPTTSYNHSYTSKFNHWASTQSYKASMTCSDHLTCKTIMKIKKSKKIIHLITFFNQLHGKHSIRSTYHTTLQATSCQLVFGRDMIHNIAFRANWDWIQKIKQDIINMSNQKENKSQIPYEYKVWDQVLSETPGILRKLSTTCTGPYPVTNVYKNGTIRIQKDKR
jgi:hypothetical protein